MTRPIKFTTPFERLIHMDQTPEIKLYKAVIVQAISDATNEGKDPKSIAARKRANEWLFEDSDDLKEVFLYANLDVGYIRGLTKTAINPGLDVPTKIKSRNVVKQKNDSSSSYKCNTEPLIGRISGKAVNYPSIKERAMVKNKKIKQII